MITENGESITDESASDIIKQYRRLLLILPYRDRKKFIRTEMSLTVDLLESLITHAEVLESLLRPNYPITEPYRKTLIPRHEEFKDAVQKLANQFHVTPLYEHNFQEQEEEHGQDNHNCEE